MRRRRRREGERAYAPELAARLAALQPQAREDGMSCELLRSATSSAYGPSAQRKWRRDVQRMHAGVRRHRARVRRAAPHRTGLIGQGAVVDELGRGRDRPASISATRTIAHQRCSASATRSAGSAAARRDSMRPFSVYDIRGGGRRGRRTPRPRSGSVAGNAHPGDPGERERARVVGRDGNRRVGRELDPLVARRRARAPRRGHEGVRRGDSRAGTRSRKSPASSPLPLRLARVRHTEPRRPLSGCRLERLVPRGPGLDRTASRGRAASLRAASGPRRVERREAALREERARDVERPAQRLAAADRDRPRSRRRARSATRWPPPSRRRRPRPARRTRAARTRAPRAASSAGRDETRVAGRDEHVRERAVAVELEAAVDRRVRARPAARASSAPSRCASRTSSACARKSSTLGW